MIAIVISEKGGAERRESYDQNEITIGRVKGNDVLLPKGNVSKRHARLILRDGRYIVTDLKSTNGTYVNHRRITHATLVRRGDRIYIGDFVLRIEGEKDELSDDHGSDRQLGISGPVTAHPEASITGGHGEVVSHFPIEHDPDEDSSPSLDLPGPPRVPSGFRQGSSSTAAASSGPQTSDEPLQGPLSPLGADSSAWRRSSKPDLDEQLAAQQQAHDHVVRQVEEAIGVEPLAGVEPTKETMSKVEVALAEALDDVSLPDGVDPSALGASARLELLGLGPLGPLLEDDQVVRVQVVLCRVLACRRGQRLRSTGLSYATEAGVARSIARLCARAGVPSPEGPQIELDLPDGRRLFVVRGEASPSGHMLTLHRPARGQSSLEQMVRAGAISRSMATVLAQCVAARANILIAGEAEGGGGELVEALVNAIPRPRRALWLSSPSDPAPDGAAQLPLLTDTEARGRAVAAAVQLASEHLVVPPLRGSELARLLDAVGQGIEGMIFRSTSGTLRHSVHRLAVELATERPGLTVATAREWLAASFDLALEMSRLDDGRLRLVRMAELRSMGHDVSLRDVFTFAYQGTAAGGSIEGAFRASGTVPRIIEDLAARGMPLDTAMFRRHPSS